MDSDGQSLPLVGWAIQVVKTNSKYGFKEFVDNFLSHSHTILYGKPSLKMHLEFRTLLQLSIELKVGDWFLYENYTIIRIYGFGALP